MLLLTLAGVQLVVILIIVLVALKCHKWTLTKTLAAWLMVRIHAPQKKQTFGDKDWRNRPDRDDFLLGSVNSAVPENRSVVSE